MQGPLRRVDLAKPGNDRQGNPDKGFEAFYTGAWWLRLSCGDVRVIPRVGFEPPVTARCEPTCSKVRRLYGLLMPPSGGLADKRTIKVENDGPLAMVPIKGEVA